MTIDPTTTGLVGTGVLWLTPAAQEFFKKIGAPIGDVAASLTERFARNLDRISADASQQLRDIGREAGEVHPRTLMPLLEAASREDDTRLAKRWAALLANAADVGSAAISPMFPEILRQLTPMDAHVLEVIVSIGIPNEAASSSGWSELHSGPKIQKSDVLREVIGQTQAEVSDETFEGSLDTVVALGLVERSPSWHVAFGIVEMLAKGDLALSRTGRRFMNACQAPTAQ